MRNILRSLAVVLMLLLTGGMLVVAVARVREAAASTQCTNNLHQLGLALRNYSETMDHCPSAAEPNPDLPPERRLSWLVTLGPYIEASNPCVGMERKKGWDAEENRYLALTTIKLFHCPAFPEQPPVSTLFPTHYIGIAGLGADAATLPQGDASAGFFGYKRNLSRAEIEGSANALLVAIETSHPSGAWTAGGPPTVRGLEENGVPYLGADGQFGGLHPGGTNALFADGSVRFLAPSTDPALMRAMVTIRGSKTETPPAE